MDEASTRHIWWISLDLLKEGEQEEMCRTLLEMLADNYRLTRQSLDAISAYEWALEP